MNRGKVRIPIDEIVEAVRGRKVGVLTNGLVWLEEAGDDLAGLIRRACRKEVLLFAEHGYRGDGGPGTDSHAAGRHESYSDCEIRCLYGLRGQGMHNIGARNVYLASIVICVICLVMLWLSGRKPMVEQEPIEQEHKEEVSSELAGAFVRVGWIGNILLMACLMILFSVFNKLATGLRISPEAHGWMVVTLRIAAMTTAGFMIMSLFWHYHWWGFLVAEGLAAVGLCLVGLTEDYWMFVLGFVLCGIMLGHNYYAGVYYSLNSVSSSDAVGQRGRAAMNESYFSVGSIAGAGLGGLAGWFSVRLPYFLAAGAVVVVLVIQLNTIRKARAGEHLRQRQ